MAQELTTASWSSLAPSDRAEVFRGVLSRAAMVCSVANIRHLTPDPLDGYLLAAIEAMERKLEPAGEQAATEALSLACQILRCRHPEGEARKAYIALLSEFPRDLLMPSIKAALQKETHHVLPSPGALLADARPRRSDRIDKLAMAKLAVKRLQIAAEWSRRGLGSC